MPAIVETGQRSGNRVAVGSFEERVI